MDNDKKIVKNIKKGLRKIHFSIAYANKNVASEEAGNKLIYDSLRVEKPIAVMRLGASETSCAYPWMNGLVPSQEILDRGKYAAGIFPSDAEHNSEFAQIYLNSIKSADIMALCDVYKEKKIVDT